MRAKCVIWDDCKTTGLFMAEKFIGIIKIVAIFSECCCNGLLDLIGDFNYI